PISLRGRSVVVFYPSRATINRSEPVSDSGALAPSLVWPWWAVPSLLLQPRNLYASLAWEFLPARRDLGRRRCQLRPLLGTRQQGRAVPVRRRRRHQGGAAHRPTRVYRHGLAWLSARRPARADLRLPRPRSLRAGEGPPLQSEQGCSRPLRQGNGPHG